MGNVDKVILIPVIIALVIAVAIIVTGVIIVLVAKYQPKPLPNSYRKYGAVTPLTAAEKSRREALLKELPANPI